MAIAMRPRKTKQMLGMIYKATNHCFLPWWLLPLLMLVTECAMVGVVKDYCERDMMYANCSTGEVILMQEARYGIMKFGTCIKLDMGYENCFSDVLPVLDKKCSGRESCEFLVVVAFLNYPNPCPEELRSYLEASFTCIPVVVPQKNCCHSLGEKLLVETESGYISSTVTAETGCGSSTCPWLIQAPIGQSIEIFLWDFEYGVPDGWPHTAFMLEFQAFGCADPLPPDNGFVERRDDLASIGCLGTDHVTWEITCRNGEWIGYFGDCTTGSSHNVTSDINENSDVEQTFINLELVIILIIAVAIILSLACIIVGVVCVLKRRHEVQRNRKHGTLAEQCGTKPCYDTCKTGVTPGDYFHQVELPYIYRRDNQLDVQVGLNAPHYETSHQRKQHSDHSMTENNAPFIDKIST